MTKCPEVTQDSEESTTPFAAYCALCGADMVLRSELTAAQATIAELRDHVRAHQLGAEKWKLAHDRKCEEAAELRKQWDDARDILGKGPDVLIARSLIAELRAKLLASETMLRARIQEINEKDIALKRYRE